MGLSTFFGFSTTDATDELPDIFPFSIKQDDFIRIDVMSIYAKILTDVVERTHGLDDEKQALLWDNCLKSESEDGLITMFAKAMTDKKDLFIIYDQALKLVREATPTESNVIREDYKKTGGSNNGIFMSFRNYNRTDMIKIYSSFEYCSVSSMHKSMNIAKAIQIKISDLRKSVSLADSAEAKGQAKSIATALGKGKDVYLDKEDSIEAAITDITTVQTAVKFLNQKRAFYIGMPSSYIDGEQTGGLNATGEVDTKAVERGLKNYYFSIVKPALEAIFKIKLSYKSQDTRQITQGLSALQTFSLVDDELISLEHKVLVINQLFDFDTEGGSDLDANAKLLKEAKKSQSTNDAGATAKSKGI
jgi:hypothetical protein